MCVFSAANEVAVAAFLARAIRFTEIDAVIANALEAVNFSEPESLDAVQTLDTEARSAAVETVVQIASLNERQDKER
jgi:1-deoxy-D-xylulose-5-phosphate reductoisomerase